MIALRPLLYVAGLLLTAPALATQADPDPARARIAWSFSRELMSALSGGDNLAAIVAARVELGRCRAANPANHATCIDLIILLSGLSAWVSDTQAQADYAIEAVRLAESDPAAAKPRLARSYLDLSTVLSRLGRYEDAECELRKAITIWETAPLLHEEDRMIGYGNLAAVLTLQGRVDETERLRRKAASLIDRRQPLSQSGVHALAALARTLHDSGKSPQEVRHLYRRAGAGAIQQLRHFTGYTPAAQSQFRAASRIFTGQVSAAWTLIVQEGVNGRRE